MRFFEISPKSYQSFGLPFLEILLPRTFKNRPIWSHRIRYTEILFSTGVHDFKPDQSGLSLSCKIAVECVSSKQDDGQADKNLCDQTFRLFFSIRPFATMQISPIMSQIFQSRLSILPNRKKLSKICQILLPKWRNFAKSGHTD